MLNKLLKKTLPCVLSATMVLSMVPQTFTGFINEPFGAVEVEAAQTSAPANLTYTRNEDGSVVIGWDSVSGASSYIISRAGSRFGTYSQIGTSTTSQYTDTNPNSGKYNNYYKVQAVTSSETSDYSEPISLEISMFGKNMYVFQDTDDTAQVNSVIADIFDQQHYSQFGENRYAYAFKAGDYTDLDNINIGYYTSIYGLSGTPHGVRLNNVKTPAALDNNNATCNFWVSIENVTIADTDNNSDVWYSFQWGASQAAPARRLLVERTASFDWFWGWASGGYVADSYFAKAAGSWSQQQYYYRNCYVNDGTYGVNWNQVIQGCIGNTVDTSGYASLTNNNGVSNWSTSRGTTTVINTTDKIREKPFLYFDDSVDDYKVFVPAMRYNSSGTSWSYGDMGQGTSLSLDSFYIARNDVDTAETINAKLDAGYNIILSPGVYYVDEPLHVKNANTVVLGLGLASVVPNNSEAGMIVDDVDGVSVAGIIFDAGTYSKTLLTIGDEGCNKDHSDNPIVLQDIFYRVGGTGKIGTTTSALVVNSNSTIVDHTWIWRADHGDNTGWYSNTADNGLVVNGDNVTCYGLFVEHFQKYDILWRGEYGKTYFLQNEKCYDPQDQNEWMSHNGTVLGYAAYKVANNVKHHYAVGLGCYDVFIQTNGADIFLENAIEVPNEADVLIENACTVEIAGGEGPLVGINHIVNGTAPAIYTGTSSGGGYAIQRLIKYNNGTSYALEDYYTNSSSTTPVYGTSTGTSDDPMAEKTIVKDALTKDTTTAAWQMTDSSYLLRISELKGNTSTDSKTDIQIVGVQLSTTNYGVRVISSVENTIGGKQVVAYGHVYGLKYNGTDAEDMYVGSTSKYVYNYASTTNGTSTVKVTSSSTATDYVMTMINNGSTADALTANYMVRAYARLSDGTYVYSDVVEYSIYNVADSLYSKLLMPNSSSHTYLYNNILKVVNPEYTEVTYK